MTRNAEVPATVLPSRTGYRFPGHKSLRALTALAVTLLLAACGGGGGSGGGNDSGGGGGGGTATPSAAPAVLQIGACLPSGLSGATDYQVGPGKAYTALHQVPWESLQAGDTVRIFYSATPYKGKFMIAATGTATAPVRVCGVRGPGGERPVIDGNGAVSRSALGPLYGSTTDVRDIHEGRSIIVIKNKATEYTGLPAHIQIDGLHITRAHPGYSFTNAAGVSKAYIDFGAAVWVERGHHVTIADNEISDSQMAVFSKSSDDSLGLGDFTVTMDLRIAGNHFHGHGIAGDVHMHTTYTQGVDVVIEFNRYGALRSGAAGNSVKDRSAGSVVRYNLIEDGAHAIDLVEAEDFPRTATALAAYRSSFVYGNLIRMDGTGGSVIHYGGDHYGSSAGANWGEPLFRKGTLYFFHNTVQLTGSGDARLFQLATTEERAEVWNNVFVFGAGIVNKNLRQTTDLNGSAWTPGGVLNLGRNWVDSGWQDSDIYHPVPGQLLGTTALIAGASAPLGGADAIPLAGGAAIDAAVSGPAAASGYPVDHQIGADGLAAARSVRGSAADLGAIER